MRMLKIFSLLLVTLYLLSGCSNDDISSEEQKTQKVNHFVLDCMQTLYLWNEDINTDINVNKERDPFSLFYKLKYKDDKWSILTDEYEALITSLSGEDLSYGYLLGSGPFSNSNNIFLCVIYVYPGSPADENGIKRGDIIVRLNGQDISKDNAALAYNSSSVELQMGEKIDSTINFTDKKIDLTATKQYQNPINRYRVLDYGSHQIGYICYTDFLIKSHEKLEEIIKEFKEEKNITDLVLDLRYNSGGFSITSKFLSSMLVSREVLENRETFLKTRYNNKFMEEWKKKDVDLNDYYDTKYSFVDETGTKYEQKINVNLGLNKIYILIGNNTASAAESTIIGVKPYMDVILIGDDTHGKYFGGSIYSAHYLYNTKDDDLYNWGIYPMMYRFMNRDGYPNFNTGIPPSNSYYIDDDPLSGIQLGDAKEALLSKAISLITGIESKEAYSSSRAEAVIPISIINPTPLSKLGGVISSCDISL